MIYLNKFLIAFVEFYVFLRACILIEFHIDVFYSFFDAENCFLLFTTLTYKKTFSEREQKFPFYTLSSSKYASYDVAVRALYFFNI